MATATSIVGSLRDRIPGLPADRIGQASAIVLTTTTLWTLTGWDALVVAGLLVPITYAFGSEFGFVTGHVGVLVLLPAPLALTEMVLLEGALAVFLITTTVTTTPTRHALPGTLLALTIAILGVAVLIRVVDSLRIATVSILVTLVCMGYLLHRYEYYRATIREVPG